jgi:beta-galactosidase
MAGLPSWLLKDNNMIVRSDYAPFLNATERYFEKLMAVAKRHQFTNGGPIIAVQIENEFADYGNTKTNKGDLIYMTFLKNTLSKFGIHELMFTCDTAKDNGGVPGVFRSINFNKDIEKNINI